MRYSPDELEVLRLWTVRNERYSDWYRRTIPAAWSVSRHIEYLCSLVQRVIDGEIQRLAISTPPGHAKSDTITRRLPLYWGERNASDAIVLTGYSQTFAEKNLSWPARELAREIGTLGDRSTALDEWRMSSGARVVVRGVGAAPTGINPISLLVCDDPVKDRRQASSEVERENVWQWWSGSIIQRFWPRTRAVIIATRWHEDDLIGRLKASDQASEWTFVNLPAIALGGDPLGRQPGEALWPEAKPIEFLERQRMAMGEYEFEAVFQGNPTPRDGSFFRVSQLAIEEAAPVGLRVVRAWDIASTAGAGDYTVGVKIGGPDRDGRFFVLDVVRGQWDTAERDRVMLQTAALDGREVCIRLPQDPGAAGKSLAASMVRLLAGYSVSAVPVTGDKQTRADPLSSQVNAGNVRLVKGEWNRAFIEELRQFPGGKYDDQVDAVADAFDALIVRRELQIY